jgi:hypothetical protein
LESGAALLAFSIAAVTTLAMVVAAACAPARQAEAPSATPRTGWTELGFSTWSRCDAYGNIVYIRQERIVVVEKGCK